MSDLMRSPFVFDLKCHCDVKIDFFLQINDPVYVESKPLV